MANKEFLEACEAKRKEMLGWLRADDRPDDAYVKDYKDQRDLTRKSREKEEGKKAEGAKGGLMGMASPAGRTTAPPAGYAQPATGGYGTGGGMTSLVMVPENMTPEEWIKTNDRAGASVKKAHEIYCYARTDGLDPRYQIPVTAKYPAVEAMWLSQVSLWIQEDIVQALAKLNNEVAGQLSEEDRWVANLPVKHLLYISIGDFQSKTAASIDNRTSAPPAPAVGLDLTRPDPPVLGATFFQRQPASDTLDVTGVAVGLVIDANSLLRVMDRLSGAGFYTPVSVQYEAVDPNPSLQDYIYGPAPTIRVRLEFDHYILRDKIVIRKDEKSKEELKYADLLPQGIKAGTYVNKPYEYGGQPQQLGAQPSTTIQQTPRGPSGTDRRLRQR